AVVWLLLAQASPGQTPACAASVDAASPIQRIGAFTNMRFTEEHAYGYTLYLWRSSSCVFGLLLSSQGLAGDTPTGLLERVRYDGKTGALSFRAKLTLGSFSNREYREVPSRDVFEVSGVLTQSALRGSVRHT